MTSGLIDYIDITKVANEIDTFVFKQWTHEELLHIIYKTLPINNDPGTVFQFSHLTNMLVLCICMEIRTGRSFKYLFDKLIIDKLKLTNTQVRYDQPIEEPVLHIFDYDRVPIVGEDSTYWNASWGAFSTSVNSDVYDMGVLGSALGSGALLTKTSYKDFVTPATSTTVPLPGGSAQYGMGIVIGGLGLDY